MEGEQQKGQREGLSGHHHSNTHGMCRNDVAQRPPVTKMELSFGINDAHMDMNRHM